MSFFSKISIFIASYEANKVFYFYNSLKRGMPTAYSLNSRPESIMPA